MSLLLAFLLLLGCNRWYKYALTESDGEPVLEVWDWDGKLTARYSLPYAFTALAYAPHDGFLYAVRAGEEKDLLYKLLL